MVLGAGVDNSSGSTVASMRKSRLGLPGLVWNPPNSGLVSIPAESHAPRSLAFEMFQQALGIRSPWSVYEAKFDRSERQTRIALRRSGPYARPVCGATSSAPRPRFLMPCRPVALMPKLQLFSSLGVNGGCAGFWRRCWRFFCWGLQNPF